MIVELLSVILGTMVTTIIGGFWYSYLFRDRIIKEMNLQQHTQPAPYVMLLELLGRALQSTLMTLMYCSLKGQKNFVLALSLAVFFTVAFQIQYYTSKVTWEQKTQNYFFMKVSEQFISQTSLALICYVFL